MPTRIEGMADLIREAKEDPKFFHALVWDTEKALGSVDFLSREEKAAFLRISPEDLVVGLATGRFGNGAPTGDCGGSCGVTCSGPSCATTCAKSGGEAGLGRLVSNPAADLATRIQNEIASGRFSHFTR